MTRKTFDELREDARNVRKEIILDATAKLFKKKSIFKISMRDIAAEAGMSAGNIYFYFEDREAIVRELMLRDEKNIIDIFKSIVKIDTEDAKVLQQKLIMEMDEHDGTGHAPEHAWMYDHKIGSFKS